MRKLVLVSAISALLLMVAVSVFAQSYGPMRGPWRVSGSLNYLTSSDARDLLDSIGWGLEGEYAFARLLNGDLSGTAGYRWFSGDEGGFDNDINYFSVGVKWRQMFGGENGGGPAVVDGFYYGWGLALAWLDADLAGASPDTTKLEWKLLIGTNFSENWFSELAYNAPGKVGGVRADNLSLAVGYRF